MGGVVETKIEGRLTFYLNIKNERNKFKEALEKSYSKLD